MTKMTPWVASGLLAFALGGCAKEAMDENAVEPWVAVIPPPGPLPALPPPVVPPDALYRTGHATEEAVSLARQVIDGYAGDQSLFPWAAEQLRDVLERVPDHPQALIESARLDILAAGFRERQLEMLDAVLETEPDNTQALELKGHVLGKLARFDEAKQALDRAGALGSTSPWLALNRAGVALAQKDFARQQVLCGEVLAMPGLPARERGAALNCRIEGLKRRWDWVAVDRDYRELIALKPGSAWARGDYADFLCRLAGRCAEAQAVILPALERMDYGLGRETLAMTLYEAWARAVQAEGELSPKAVELLVQATALEPDRNWAMSHVGAIADNRAVVTALLGTGTDIDAGGKFGSTALMRAASYGNVRAVETLLALGASPLKVDELGWDAMHWAADGGRVEVMEALLAAGHEPRNPALLMIAANAEKQDAMVAWLAQRYPTHAIPQQQ